MARAEADDLAPADGRTARQQRARARGRNLDRLPPRPVPAVSTLVGAERREAVLKDDHVIVGGRDLGQAFRRRGAERALASGGLKGAVLAVAMITHSPGN